MAHDDAEFLKEYALETAWAAEHRISQRTAKRYRDQPNGLPYLQWGGEIYIPRREGAEYIKSRVKRRNQRRRSGDS